MHYALPETRKHMVAQGPFDVPSVVKHAHAAGKPFPLARSGATAVAGRCRFTVSTPLSKSPGAQRLKLKYDEVV